MFNVFLRWIKKAQVARIPLVTFATEPPKAATHYANYAGLQAPAGTWGTQ